MWAKLLAAHIMGTLLIVTACQKRPPVVAFPAVAVLPAPPAVAFPPLRVEALPGAPLVLPPPVVRSPAAGIYFLQPVEFRAQPVELGAQLADSLIPQLRACSGVSSNVIEFGPKSKDEISRRYE